MNLQRLLNLKPLMGKLETLFTPENRAFLDRLLNGLTNPETPGYHAFWGWFRSGQKDPESYAKAYRALRQLIDVLRSAK